MFLKMGRMGELFATTRGFGNYRPRLPVIIRDEGHLELHFRSLYVIWSPQMPTQEADGSIDSETVS